MLKCLQINPWPTTHCLPSVVCCRCSPLCTSAHSLACPLCSVCLGPFRWAFAYKWFMNLRSDWTGRNCWLVRRHRNNNNSNNENDNNNGNGKSNNNGPRLSYFHAIALGKWVTVFGPVECYCVCVCVGVRCACVCACATVCICASAIIWLRNMRSYEIHTHTHTHILWDCCKITKLTDHSQTRAKSVRYFQNH